MTTEPGRLAGILVITLVWTPHRTKPARGKRVTQLMRTVSSLLVIIAAPGWLANWAHTMKPFRKCRVQFVSDAFAFVSDCQCVLLPRSPGMCLSTWAMRNLKFGHRHKILKAVKEKLTSLPELGM